MHFPNKYAAECHVDEAGDAKVVVVHMRRKCVATRLVSVLVAGPPLHRKMFEGARERPDLRAMTARLLAWPADLFTRCAGGLCHA